jgi:hypothetical protein
MNGPGSAGGFDSREDGAMEARKMTKTFSPEVKNRAVRMVLMYRGPGTADGTENLYNVSEVRNVPCES